MVNFGNMILYASMTISVIALVGLLLKELKNNDLLTRFVSPMILVTAGLLGFAYILLTYYFVVGDYIYEYVWQYSSRDLPLIYKISGAWAGQPGTYLLWVLVIFISSAWLALSTRHATPLSRRTQIITVIIGIYFIVLTLIMTPFKTIYEGRPDLLNYVPPDGSGLNALLVNFWMILHPPLMFIGYAAMTIPFATAIVYLITKEDGWEELGRQWARFTWLFLGMGIAVGGVWAYMVLGWGGFWAWDPVETASFIPWLTLTGFLHAAALHRKNRSTFSIAAPILAAVSFILVIYAAIVVRSGLFNSVHAFGEASTGTLLISAVFITTLASVALGMRRYFEESDPGEDPGFWSKTNIFYITLLLFVVLAFISFWGISYPVFIQLTQGLKVNVASDTKNFFNVWSYPFTIILLLALGFCLNYKESNKEKQKQTLFIVAALSVIFMLPRTANFYVLDHSSPFWIREPTIYKLIGSISILSIFPPLLYAAYSIISYLRGYLHVASQRIRIKGVGITMVHIAIVLVLFSAIISSTLDQKIQGINIPLEAKGQLLDIGNGYGVKILDYSTHSLVGNSGSNSVTLISEILASPSSYESNPVKISGKVSGLKPLEDHGTLVELSDNSGSMWVVLPGNLTEATLPKDTPLTVTGTVLSGFQQPILSVTDVGESDSSSSSGKYNVQSVQLEVYQGSKKIGSGTAEYLEGKGGSGTFPMVKSGLTGTDVYVTFQGIGGGYIPLTLQIKPAIDFAWVGIIFFAIGIILIMAVKPRAKGVSETQDKT